MTTIAVMVEIVKNAHPQPQKDGDAHLSAQEAGEE